MSHAMLMTQCYDCGQPIICNPTKVPSIKDPDTGTLKPLCADCIKAIQDVQREQGLPIWPNPLPGAYEACPEDEFPW